MPPITRTAFRIYIAALLLSPVIGYFEPTELPPLPPEAIQVMVISVLIFVVPFLGAFAFV